MSVSLPTVAMCQRTLQGRAEEAGSGGLVGAQRDSRAATGVDGHRPPASGRGPRASVSPGGCPSPLSLGHDHAGGVAEDVSVDGVLEEGLGEAGVGHAQLGCTRG